MIIVIESSDAVKDRVVLVHLVPVAKNLTKVYMLRLGRSLFICHTISTECTLLRAMNLRCGPKQGSQKRRNTTHNAIFHHQRNFDPSDFVPAPDVTLTPSSDSGIPEVSIEGLDLSESEMMTSSSVRFMIRFFAGSPALTMLDLSCRVPRVRPLSRR